MRNFAAAVEKSRDGFVDEIEKIAEELRTSLIIPACKKHKLTFTAGNGTFFFRKVDDGSTYYIDDKEEARAFGINLDKILDALWLEITSGDYLGYYVRDVE